MSFNSSFNSLSEIWSYYDAVERKRFTAHDITAAINQLPEDNPDAEQCRYEALAFGFVPSNRENEWGTYYGSQLTFTKKDTGEEVYVPDISSVTPEIISYWETRATTVVNPLLKMRYTGLVLDFKKRITGKQPDYKTIKLANIETIIAVIAGDYAGDLTSLCYAERALKLATGFRKAELVQRVAKAFFEAHKRMAAPDSKPGLWCKIVQSLIKYPEAFEPYKEEIIQENIERLTRLETSALEEGVRTDNYAHILSDQVDILCEYYHAFGEDEKIDGLLDRLLVALKKPIPVRGGMWGQSMLERMQRRYRKYGMDKKANRLYVDISDLGSKVLEEMQKHEHSFTLEREKIDAFIKAAMEGTHEDRLVRYIINYLPVREDEIKKRKEHAQEFPLEDIVSTISIDDQGNTITRIGAGKNAEEQKLHHFMYNSMTIGAFFMQLHMEELKKNKDVTLESLMSLFEDCPLVIDSHREFLKRGLEAYMNDDHMVCCHILIPQIEAMIRRLIALKGGAVLRQSADPAAGNEYYSLESLLDSPVAKECMKEDMITYFKVLFVSDAGWNLRNLISHGLINANSFNYTMSDRVVHALLILSQFKRMSTATQN